MVPLESVLAWSHTVLPFARDLPCDGVVHRYGTLQTFGAVCLTPRKRVNGSPKGGFDGRKWRCNYLIRQSKVLFTEGILWVPRKMQIGPQVLEQTFIFQPEKCVAFGAKTCRVRRNVVEVTRVSVELIRCVHWNMRIGGCSPLTHPRLTFTSPDLLEFKRRDSMPRTERDFGERIFCVVFREKYN